MSLRHYPFQDAAYRTPSFDPIVARSVLHMPGSPAVLDRGRLAKVPVLAFPLALQASSQLPDTPRSYHGERGINLPYASGPPTLDLSSSTLTTGAAVSVYTFTGYILPRGDRDGRGLVALRTST